MTRFALTYEFDGTPFQGLQRQAHGPSVQQSIEQALHKVTGETCVLHSAGRTDTGVHALAMRSHVDLAKDIAPFRLMEALNAHLRPDPIAVNHCEMVDEDWHARFSCTGRRYLYRIVNRRAPLALARDRAWQVAPELDVEAMQRAAQAFVGQHDFTTFRSVQCQARDLKLVGQGTWQESQIARALAARDRAELGLNAPPHGLYFVEAVYPTAP